MNDIKVILAIILLTFICINCTEFNNERKGNETKILKIDSSITNKQIKESVVNKSYIVKNGIVIDSIDNEQLIEKVLIVNSKEIENEQYVIYAKYMIEDPVRFEMSLYYEGHFLNLGKKETIIIDENKLLKYKDLFNSKDEFNIGECCFHSNKIEFEKLNIVPDNGLYLYLIVPQCSDWNKHIVLKRDNNTFTKLFEIESTDTRLNFNLKNDSTVYCQYKEVTEYSVETFDFEYNLAKQQIIK